ncbi:MAG: hypothetical protein QOE33_3269 [Acidobacteriota bacterium]|nr:hypothetical protein [Acidobacteriota bacterium]
MKKLGDSTHDPPLLLSVCAFVYATCAQNFGFKFNSNIL